MPRIVWTEEYSVGVPKLDDQHKKWIAMINEMHDALMSADIEGLRQIGEKTLRSIMEYGEQHFADEELYMEECGYPCLEEHRTMHQVFRHQTVRNLDRIHKGEVILNRDIMQEMLAWLSSHLLVEDKKYASAKHAAER